MNLAILKEYSLTVKEDMNFRNILYTLLLFLGISNIISAPASKLVLKDEDIAALEAMGFSREEALETASLINNMSPDEQNALAQIGQQVAKDMSSSGLNPNDPEQMINFLSTQAPATAPTKPPVPGAQVQPSQIESKPQPMATPTPRELLKNPKATTDVQLLIKEILEHLESFRQKASTTWKMSKKLEKYKNELDELIFYLNSINRKELVPFLSSQEFSRPYAILDGLHRALVTHEPKIAVFPFFEEDEIINPYKILDISIRSSKKEIDSAYKKLKQKNDPDIISKSAKFKKLTKKEQKKFLTEAKLNLDEIQEAYDLLSDPKEKLAIDKDLREFEILQEKNEQMSDHSFELLANVLLEAIHYHKLIKEIQSILQKFSPEEKKKADEWEKLRLSALEASKREYEGALSRGRTGKVMSLPLREEVGEKYWSQFRVSEPPRAPYQPFVPSFEPSFTGKPAFSDPFGPTMPAKGPEGKPGGSGGGPKPGGEKAGGGEKSGGDKSSGGGDKGSKEQMSETKSGKKDSEMSEMDKAELYQLMHPKDLEIISKSLKDTKKDSLANIFKEDLFKYLINPVPEIIKKIQNPEEQQKLEEEDIKKIEEAIDPSLKKINDFTKKVNLSQIEADFADLAKKASSTSGSKKENLKKIWQEVKNKYGDGILKLGSLAETLEPNLWQSRFGRMMNSEQEDFHLLKYKVDIYRDEAVKKKLALIRSKQTKLEPIQEGYLGSIKLTIENIVDLYKKINKALGLPDKGK